MDIGFDPVRRRCGQILAKLSGVTVHDFDALTPVELNNMVNGPGTTIGGFCNSAVCITSKLD